MVAQANISQGYLRLRAENETRTRDPNLGKVVLYQLSYFRIVASAKVMLFLHSTKRFTFFKIVNVHFFCFMAKNAMFSLNSPLLARFRFPNKPLCIS